MQQVINNKHCILDLSNYGLLQIEGPDAKKLLQGQLTCNVDDVTASASMLSALCNPQGRVISLFGIFNFNNAYYLIMQRSMISMTLKVLKKYAVFYNTLLTDVSEHFGIIGYIGPNAAEIVAKIADDFYKIQLPDSRIVIIGHAESMKTLWNELSKDHTTGTIETWHALDIKNCIPNIYPETSEKFLPHDLNLQQLGAINFDKGCYTGQEIIARMHYRGKLKNHMYLATLASPNPPAPGADVYYQDDHAKIVAGTVVDSSRIAPDMCYALIITDAVHLQNNDLFTNENDALTILENKHVG